MILVMVAVWDSAVQSFGTPFFVTNVGGALRSFKDEVNRTDGASAVATNPDDFTLYEIGTFDNESGKLSGPVENKVIARGKDLVINKE